MYGYHSEDSDEIGRVDLEGRVALVIKVAPTALSDGGVLEVVEGLENLYVLVNTESIDRAIEAGSDAGTLSAQIMQAATRAVVNWVKTSEDE